MDHREAAQAGYNEDLRWVANKNARVVWALLAASETLVGGWAL